MKLLEYDHKENLGEISAPEFFTFGGHTVDFNAGGVCIESVCPI